MIEDDIAAIMAEHDNEAPTIEELVTGLRSRRRSYGWLYAAAAAVLVIGVVSGVWAVTRGKPANKVAAVPLSCPARYAEKAPWVPAKPKGISGNSRLVPNETPKSAVICSYDGVIRGRSPSRWALAGNRRITGNLAGLAAELTWQPRIAPGQQFKCLSVLGQQTNYLIGLTYSRGRTMWVSTTADVSGCVTGTNGLFDTPPDTAAADVGKALKSGSWPEAQPPGCKAGWGRLGQDKTMVPAGSTSLTICGARAHRITSDYRDLVGELNGLRTPAWLGVCARNETGTDYRMVFGYPAGPPAVVIVSSACQPPVYNGGTESDNSGAVVPTIRHLLGQR